VEVIRNQQATADAGTDVVICEGEDVTLNGSIGGSATSLQWTTLGDGTFGDDLSASTTYTPGTGDLANGSVQIVLNSDDPDAAGPCTIASDTLTITIGGGAVVNAGTDQAICEGDEVALNGSIGGAATSATWNTNGSGVFADPNSLSTTYIPSAADVAAGNVLLTLTTDDPAGACTEESSTINVTIQPVNGDEVTYGNETWIGYVYQGENFDTYRGYIENTDIAGAGNGSAYDDPSDAFNYDLITDPVNGPNVCGSYENSFSIRYRMRKTLPAGLYTFTVGSDDGLRFSIDGGTTWLIDDFELKAYSTSDTTVCLDGTYDFVIEYFERNGLSRLTYDVSPDTNPQTLVDLTADRTDICAGETVTFTASVTNGGDSPVYEWLVSGVTDPAGSGDTYQNNSLVDGDIVTVSVTPDPAFACGSAAPVTSNPVTINVPGALTASVTVSADQTFVCAGETVTFTAVGTDAGANPTYQWFVNGVEDNSSTSDTYSTSSLSDGDEVFAVLTADPSASCVTNSPVTSNTVTISVTSTLVADVTLSADRTEICEGDEVTLTATPTEAGANPTYEWQLNGVTIPGITDPVYTTNTLVNGDQVTVVLTADPTATCVTNSPVTSNAEIFTVSPVPGIAEDAVADVSSCGAADGSITVTVTGGSGTFDYLWTGPNGFTASTEDISGLTAGTYELIATDVITNCSASYTATISEPVDFTIQEDNVTPVSACSASDGAIEISLTGGSGTFSFAWTGPDSFTASTEDISGLAPGTYDLVVTDDVSGCIATYSTSLADPIDFTAQVDNASDVSACGANDGSIDISITGGSGTFTFAWSGPDGFTSIDEDLSGLAPGTYEVIVTDDNSTCQTTLTAEVGGPTGISVQEEAISPISACGSNDGAVDISVLDGSGDYTYAWTGPDGFTATTEDLSGLSEGTYDLTVTDNVSACTATYSVVFTEPVDVIITEDNVTPISACGAADGAIEVSVSGGSGVFSYEWVSDNGFTSSDEDISGLQSGTYDLTVRDNVTGCSVTYSTTLTDPIDFTIQEDAKTQVSACGAADGAIEITVAGGSGVFSYEWTSDNGFTSTSEDITGLSPGTYDLSVRDNITGCIDTYSATISDAVDFTIQEDAVTQVSGCGASDGAIEITVAGGSGVFSYEWSADNGFSSTDEDISGLSAGNYVLTVRDNVSGCEASYSVSLTQPSGISVTEDIVSDVTACNIDDGEIAITVENGSGDYTFAWTGPDGFTSTDEDLTGLANGTYDLVVTDNVSGCTATYSATISEPVNFTITEDAITAISACGAADGAIELTVASSDPVSVLTYNWTGPNGFTASTEDISGLSAGVYTLTVRELSEECSDTYTIELTDPVDFTINEESVTDITGCNTADGAIDISVSGGSGVFSFDWTGPNGFTASGEDLSGLDVPGDYTVSVYDNIGGCRAEATFTVNSAVEVTNPSVSLTADKAIACQGEEITFTAAFSDAGANPTFDWFVNGVETLTAAGPQITLNSLANGDEVSVVLNVDPSVACPAATEVNAGPVAVTIRSIGDPECGSVSIDCGLFTVTLENDKLILPTCSTNDDGLLAFAVSGGNAPYILTLRNDSLSYLTSLPGNLEGDGKARFEFPDLAAGNYTYTVQDSDGAICSLPVTLRNATRITASASGFVDAACYGENTGQARLNIANHTGGSAEYSFDGGAQWYSFVDNQVVNNLPPNGIYTILVRDDATDQCPAEVSVTINSASPAIELSQEITTETPADCNPNVTVGVINIGTVSGGNGGPYTFTIDDKEDPQPVPADGRISGISRNDNLLIVYDGSGCSMPFAIDVDVPGAIEAEVIELTVDECSGSEERGIAVVIDTDRTDAPGPYELVLNNADTPDEGEVYAIPSSNELEVRGLDKGVLYRWTVRSAAINSCSDDGEIRLTSGTTPVAFEAEEVCSADGRPSVLFTNFSGEYGTAANPLQVYVYEQTGLDPVYTFAKNAIILDDFEINSNQFAWEPGGYKIYVTQRQGSCDVSSEPVFVTISSPLTAEIIETSISLPDEPTGSVSIEVPPTAGTPGYSASIYHTQPTFQDRMTSPILDLPLNVNPDGDYQLTFTDLYPGNYLVVVQDAKGCTYELEDSLGYDDSIFVPNVFTPNGDGSNPVFYIRNLPSEGAGVVITNRWGRTVYQSENYQNDWDGGDETEGVYYYEVRMPSGQILTGWVEIWRGPAY
ncbi:gliding motility-associated C-terminal domain-containing protein, partial [Roseivirga sp. BDSF3-8]|uniref:T9SS type B sorting domain-containing protein n=1 Tax=Roseivirga sp. BDSF3-8 TaxID=3241598 RepID=UPI003532760A